MLTWISHFGSLSFWLLHFKKVEIKKILQSKHFCFGWMSDFIFKEMYRYTEKHNHKTCRIHLQIQSLSTSTKRLIKAYITPLNKIPIYTSIKMKKLSPSKSIKKDLVLDRITYIASTIILNLSNNLFLSYYLVFMKSVLLLPILSNIFVHDLWALCSFFIPFYNLCYLL